MRIFCAELAGADSVLADVVIEISPQNLGGNMSHVSALLNVLFSTRPAPPIRSLLKRPSSIEKHFIKRSVVTINRNGEYLEVRINGELLLWEPSLQLDLLLRIMAEQSRFHPHRYDWGNTRLSPGDVVLDIGACEGSFSAYAASIGARVVTIEPSRRMIKLIERLFELRNLKPSALVNKLIGRSDGELQFLDDQENIASSKVVPAPTKDSYPVEVVTLDELVTSLQLDRVDFIKCDAEGADVDIIRSGDQSIRRFHPRIAVTTYHADDHYSLLADYFSALNYRIRGSGYIYIHGKYRPVMIHAS
jgi:FkbM family methyltransferase